MTLYRKIMDSVLILTAIAVFTPYALTYLSSMTYEDLTIPDELTALDERLAVEFDRVEPTFMRLLEHPQPLGDYTLTYATPDAALTPSEVYEKSVENVVYINTIGTDGYWYAGAGTILTKDGLILTNYHVITDSDKVLVVTHDNKIYEATSVVAADPELDVAFFTVDAADLTPIQIGNSDTLSVGDTLYTIGHAEGLVNTFSDGIVSGFRDYSSLGEGMQIQITNPISGGNSGGALLDQYGALVGIPTSVLEYEYNVVQVQNINFAVPINAALKLLEQY